MTSLRVGAIRRHAAPGRDQRGPRPPVWLWLPAMLIGVVAGLPLLYLVIRASEGSEAAWLVLLRPKTLQVLWNTTALVGAVAGTTIVLGVLLAWLTTRTDLPGRRLWATLAALPLVIPSYVGALALVAALGPRGLLPQALAPLGVGPFPSLYGFGGAWLALSLFTLPYPYLAVRAAILGLDPGLEEAARGLGLNARQTFWRVTVPQLRPAMAAGALLAGLYTLGDFGVVTLLRYDAFTRAIYTSYRSSFDRSAAAMLALALVLLTVAVLVAEIRLRGRATLYRANGGTARRQPVLRLGRWRGAAVLFCGALSALAIGLPVVVLGFWLARSLQSREMSPLLLSAAHTSLTLGLGAAAVAALAALPVAVLIVRYGGGIGAVVERIALFSYALPGIVLAIAYVAISVRTPWYQTLGVLILACAARFLPQASGATRLSLGQVNPRLEEAARGLGRSLPRALWAITIPLVRPGLGAGALLVFATTLKELPMTLLLIPIGERSLPTLIWTAAADARYGEAAAPALLLVLITAVPTLLLARRDQAMIG